MQDLPKPSTWDDANWQKVAAAWGPAKSTDWVAKRSVWRNRRLAALAAHKKKEA